MQALRLLLVTPLILTRFEPSEIASWYLFGSLLAFGALIAGRVQLTFSRMIAFSMAGATNLAPIKGKLVKRGSADPNWEMVRRSYQTIGGLNALLTICTVSLAVGLGYFGLRKIVEVHSDPNQIWAAFLIILCGDAVKFYFQKFQVALKGMNYVALVNRWNVVFSLLSILSGMLALLLGANIWQLALVMQLFNVITVIRMWVLLRYVEEGRFKAFSGRKLDREILRWSWEPIWKGFAVAAANSVALKLAAVIYAANMEVEKTAAFLLTMRLLDTAKSVSSAPFASHMPKMSKLTAAGDVKKLRLLIEKKIAASQTLLVASSLALFLLGPLLLNAIGSNVNLLGNLEMAVLIALLVLKNGQNLGIMSAAVGNDIICFRTAAIAAFVAIFGMLAFVSGYGYYGIVLSLYLPPLILINIRPFLIISAKMEASPLRVIVKGVVLPIAVLGFVLLGYFGARS